MATTTEAHTAVATIRSAPIDGRTRVTARHSDIIMLKRAAIDTKPEETDLNGDAFTRRASTAAKRAENSVPTNGGAGLGVHGNGTSSEGIGKQQPLDALRRHKVPYRYSGLDTEYGLNNLLLTSRLP